MTGAVTGSVRQVIVRLSHHGHVVKNARGLKARCGGPAICRKCARELADVIANRALRLGEYLIWCIYDHPTDYPHNFVVRPWREGGQPYLTALIASTLQEARTLVPEGLVRVKRLEADDPPIVECWM